MRIRLTRRAVVLGGTATISAMAIAPALAAPAEVFRVAGRVKWFDASKGYGFIRFDGGLSDALIHQRCLATSGFETAHEGATIVVDVMRRSRGLQASRVCTMGPEPMGPPAPRLHRLVAQSRQAAETAGRVARLGVGDIARDH